MAKPSPIVVQFDLRYDRFALWSASVFLVGILVGRFTRVWAVPFGLVLGYGVVVIVHWLASRNPGSGSR